MKNGVQLCVCVLCVCVRVCACVCVLHAPGCSKQTQSFSKNMSEDGYPSNQDTREVKAKKV